MNAGDASAVEAKLRDAGADVLVLEKDISDEAQVREIFDADVRVVEIEKSKIIINGGITK